MMYDLITKKRADSKRVQLDNSNGGERTRNMNTQEISHFDDVTVLIRKPLIRSLENMRTDLLRECFGMTL